MLKINERIGKKEKAMKLALSYHIPQIDKYSSEISGISVLELMGRAGRAVASAVREYREQGAFVVILAGSGNNGGDGYAAALCLMESYRVKVFDVFAKGQRTDEGKHYLELYKQSGGELEELTLSESQKDEIKSALCIVDAVFGTGFKGQIPDKVRELAVTVSEAVGAVKIAVDVPMGVNADDGSVDILTPSMHATVEMSFIKPGIVSYPARSFVGRIIYDGLGLPCEEIARHFDLKYSLIDEAYAEANLPRRDNNSHKGSFGKALLITGSECYPGAGRLSLEAALRGGAGLVTYLGTGALAKEYSRSYPEAIYKPMCLDDPDAPDFAAELSKQHSSALIGSGSGNTESVFKITKRLLCTEGGALVIDADAINSLAAQSTAALEMIRGAKRPVILTPHPLEFARLSGNDVAAVQRNRLAAATKFAAENKCILVLKGAGTIVTDGTDVYINTSGSSALAKAGSGDVLAGFIASLCAQNISPAVAAALGVYYHGAAGDSLAEKFSTYGVIPSDLPRQIAIMIGKTEAKR